MAKHRTPLSITFEFYFVVLKICSLYFFRIYIESGYLSKRTKKAKDGDIISIEIYTDEKDTKKRLGRFRKNNNPIGAETIDLEGKGLYPCLSMESKGAAVQILEDEFWYLDEDGTVSFKEIHFSFQSHYQNN